MRVLLTGGLGFIGHHTVEHLLQETDWEIIVIDALRHVGRSDRLADIEGYDPDRVNVYWHDLRSSLLPLYRKLGGIDYIINMASDSHVDRSLEDPVPFVTNNVALVMTVLEFARDAESLKKFIQVGTDEVFGPAPEGVSHDEGAALRPSNPYSASKAAQEVIAQAWWRAYGVPVILTRTMNNFGERQDVEKYVPKVIKKVLGRETIEVHAEKVDGEWKAGSRIWLHARNHADALLHILNTVEPKTHEEQDRPESFNIAGDQEWDNLEIVNLVERYTRRNARVEMVDFHSSRPGHDMRYALDGSKLAATGWKMPIASEESFSRTVRWYMDNTDWL